MPSENWPARLSRDVVQTDEVDQLVDAASRDAVRLREREQMVVRRTAGVDRARLEQRADLVQRRRMVAVVLAVHRHVAGGRRVEPEDQPHRRRLPGAVRAEEAGDDAGPHRERQVVDGTLVAVVLGEIARLDQAVENRSRAKRHASAT